MWWSCLHINSPWYLAKWTHISAHVLVELETFHWKWCSPNHTRSWIFRSCQNLTQPEILAVLVHIGWMARIVMLESSELGPSWCHVKRPAIKLPEMTKEAEVLLIALTWNYLKWPMKLIICRTISCSRNLTLVLVKNSFNIRKNNFFQIT